MTPEPPLPDLDLLVVGGMTIDRFADGRSAPGGTAVHVARSAAVRGMRLGVMTSAGPEPEAERGLAELRRNAAFVMSTSHAATPSFHHDEDRAGRRLWLERVGGPVRLDAPGAARVAPRAVLYAPIAGEIGVESLGVWDGSTPRAGILQGWLRTTGEEMEVAPLPLAAIDSAAVAVLATFDLLVASREDLAADAADSGEQLTALRRTFGPGPVLILTDGVEGLWIDTGGARQHLPAPWVVRGAPTVGAGDILAACLIISPSEPGADWTERARRAMRIVAEDLEARKLG